MHHELPDIVVPYKRYDSGTAEAVLGSSGKKEEGDYPCEASTATRMKTWFFLLHEYFENSLRAVQALWDVSTDIRDGIGRMLPLYPLARLPAGWLGHLVRMIVNSGRWPQTRSA